jgi:hypothetical protein
MLSEASHNDTTALIVRDLEVLVMMSYVLAAELLGDLGQEVSNAFIVNFAVTDADSDGLIKFSTRKGEDLADSSWQDAAVLEVRLTPCHGVGLARPGLSIAKYSSIVSVNHRLNDLTGT